MSRYSIAARTNGRGLLAALDRARRAVTWSLRRGGGGDRKDSNGKRSEDGELGEHVEKELCVQELLVNLRDFAGENEH